MKNCVYRALTFIYNNLRIASIGINFIFILIIIYQLSLFICFVSQEEQPSQTKPVSELELAIRTVVIRTVVILPHRTSIFTPQYAIKQ
jgi:hypothetical protein